MAEADRTPRHPRHGLDENLLTPVRLSLMAAIGDAEVDFLTLRDVLETSDSVLSKAVAHLSEAGYLKVRKGLRGESPAHLGDGDRAGPAGLRDARAGAGGHRPHGRTDRTRDRPAIDEATHRNTASAPRRPDSVAANGSASPRSP
jgi:hypothetical protein